MSEKERNQNDVEEESQESKKQEKREELLEKIRRGSSTPPRIRQVEEDPGSEKNRSPGPEVLISLELFNPEHVALSVLEIVDEVSEGSKQRTRELRDVIHEVFGVEALSKNQEYMDPDESPVAEIEFEVWSGEKVMYHHRPVLDSLPSEVKGLVLDLQDKLHKEPHFQLEIMGGGEPQDRKEYDYALSFRKEVPMG